MRADTLTEVAGADWDPLLDRLELYDAYLRRGYLESAAVLAPAEPVLLQIGTEAGAVVFAALVREDPIDVITPYGYGGPVAAGPTPPAAAFAEAYERWCAERGVVSSFVVYHPLFANQGLPAPAFHREPLAGTIAWNLEQAGLLEAMHRHHRRMVRRATSAGLEVRVAVAPRELGGFRSLYEETMLRAGADPFYRFGDGYFSALTGGVPLVAVGVYQGETQLAGVLGLTGPPWLHYHLGASSDAGRALGASHLALYALARWGQEHGYARLHLGGGVGGRRDSLYLYKQRFAPTGELPAAVGKAVHAPERYRALTGRPEISYQGFFPAYRAPR